MAGYLAHEGFLRDIRLEGNDSVASQRATSFVSLNHTTTRSFQVCSRGHSGGIDSDRLYDLPRDSQETVVAPKRRKRTQLRPGLLNPHEDALLLRTTGAEILESETATPPNSKKRLLGNAGPSDSKQNRLVSMATITKPFPRPTSTHWTTTEEAVKASKNGVSTTTLGKLATFRFGASRKHQLPLPPSEVDSHPYDPVPPNPKEDAGQLDSYDFDDGLADEDLLDIDQDPGAGHSLQPHIGNDQGGQLSFKNRSTLRAENSGLCSTEQQASPTHDIPVDDEFPMDEEDEMEMIQLSLLDRPTDLTGSRSDGKLASDTDFREVCENSHQFLHFRSSIPDANAIKPGSVSANGKAEDQITGGSTVFRWLYSILPEDKDGAIICHGRDQEFMTASDTRLSKGTPRNLVKSDDSAEYLQLPPFARPEFPKIVRDRSPIAGVSANIILRTCFRIGEAFRVGAMCNGIGQDMIIELFARAISSSRDAGTTKQHFQFADLFHDRPPFPSGVLENYKVSPIQASESAQLLGEEVNGRMIRCLGRLKRGPRGWMFHIINIRPTDWEEVRWTRQIVGTGILKSENHAAIRELQDKHQD